MKPCFPTQESILSAEMLAESVLPDFGIGKVKRCQFYQGGFNHTYIITTEAGKTFYARVYRHTWRTLADAQVELDALNYIKSRGGSAIQPLPYKDGQYYCSLPAPEGTRHLAVFTEATGVEVRYDADPAGTATCYAQAVAHLHDALDGFTSPHQRFELNLAHFIDQPLHHIAPFMAEKRPEDWLYVQQFAEKLRRNLLALPLDALEFGFCHGDLQGYHANVAPNGTLTFYDFDCGGFGWRAYDLAVFLWCCRLQEAVETRWQPFLQAYRQARPIKDLDVSAVPLFVCARYLWHMGVHTQNAADWGVGFLNDAYFKNHLGQLKQAETDYLA